MKDYFAPSELIINDDGSVFHLHLRPEQLAQKVILVGDPGRVQTVAAHLDHIECDVASREFHSSRARWTVRPERPMLVTSRDSCTEPTNCPRQTMGMVRLLVTDFLPRWFQAISCWR